VTVLLILLGLMMPNFMVSSAQSFHGLRLLNVLMGSNRHEVVSGLAGEIDRYRSQTGQYPSSLAALAATSGFEQDRGFVLTPGIGYALTTVSDSVWSYNRAVIVGIDVSHTSLTSFLASNMCGTGDFSVASDWCGGKQTGDWYKTEDRSAFMKETTQARMRLNQTLVKFIASFNSTNAFPSGSLSIGGSTSLASLAGAVAVTATSCTGTYTFAGIPLECGDLFTVWGGQVTYNYIGTSYISLMADTPFTYQVGGHQQVSAEMHF